jgi:hypothetical protein
MMEDLTESLRKALARGDSIRFRDPDTERIYVLVPEEVNGRQLQNEPEEEGISPAIRRAKGAFLRDLPSLLENPKYDRWSVAYCGDERVKLAASQKDVIRECLKRGLKRSEYYIGVVAPHDYEGEIEGTLAEFEQAPPRQRH